MDSAWGRRAAGTGTAAEDDPATVWLLGYQSQFTVLLSKCYHTKGYDQQTQILKQGLIGRFGPREIQGQSTMDTMAASWHLWNLKRESSLDLSNLSWFQCQTLGPGTWGPSFW